MTDPNELYDHGVMPTDVFMRLTDSECLPPGFEETNQQFTQYQSEENE